jgi:integrase
MPKALRLIASLSDVTSLRKTDCRLLQLSDITEERVIVKPSKTNRKGNKAPPALAFARTPAIEAILEEAKTLPGRKISLFVFPTKKGTPYTENALQLAWQRTKKRAGLEKVDVVFRDIRTTEINQIHDAGGDATTAAGHADKRTTERHYINVATKVTPRR